MEIRRANERVAEDDFSSIEVAIEVAGRAEDGEEDEAEMDNSDFVHGLPVPPENNLGVRVFNFIESFLPSTCVKSNESKDVAFSPLYVEF